MTNNYPQKPLRSHAAPAASSRTDHTASHAMSAASSRTSRCVLTQWGIQRLTHGTLRENAAKVVSQPVSNSLARLLSGSCWQAVITASPAASLRSGFAGRDTRSGRLL